MITPEPLSVLRPVLILATKIVAPEVDEHKYHKNLQSALIRDTAHLVRGFKSPLHATKVALPDVPDELIEDFEQLVDIMQQISDSIAPPSWRKRLVFWRETDPKPTLELFVDQLTMALDCLRQYRPFYKAWKLGKDKPSFSGSEDYWELKDLIETTEQNLRKSLNDLAAARDEADKKLFANLRGMGYATKS